MYLLYIPAYWGADGVYIDIVLILYTDPQNAFGFLEIKWVAAKSIRTEGNGKHYSIFFWFFLRKKNYILYNNNNNNTKNVSILLLWCHPNVWNLQN